MASIGHIAVGLAAARLYHQAYLGPRSLLGVMAICAALALLPDADVIAFALHIPYRAPFGHRGASHSLVAAAACGLCGMWVLYRAQHRSGLSRLRLGLFLTGLVASHGLLDTLTDGGLGVALAWPLDLHRYFAPIRPIPVAPIGARLLSPYGYRVLLTELVYFFPLLVYALWPRRRPDKRAINTADA